MMTSIPNTLEGSKVTVNLNQSVYTIAFKANSIVYTNEYTR